MALAMIEAAEADGAPAARPAGRRVHRRQHRLVAGLRLRGEGLPAADRVLGRVRGGEAPHHAGVRRRRRADPQPGRHHARPDPGDDAPGRRDRRRDGRASRPTSSTTPTWSTATGGSARSSLEQLPGPPAIAAFCCYVGTAGCFLGTTRALRAALPALHRVAVEPAESAVLSGGPPGTHHIEGGGTGRRPPQLTPADFDEVIAVPEAEAFAMARRPPAPRASSPARPPAPTWSPRCQVARRLGPGHRVVTVQVDSGLKYLAGALRLTSGPLRRARSQYKAAATRATRQVRRGARRASVQAARQGPA